MYKIVSVALLLVSLSSISHQASVTARTRISVKDVVTTASPNGDKGATKQPEVQNATTVAPSNSTAVPIAKNSTAGPVASNSTETLTDTPSNSTHLASGTNSSVVEQPNEISKNNTDSKNATEQFLDILPMENITKVLDKHLATDGGYAAAVLYLQGPEWTKLWGDLSQKQEWKDLMRRYNESGIPVNEFLDYLLKAIKDAKPTAKPAPKPSMRKATDDVLEIMPFDKIMAALNGENSPASKAMSEPESRELLKKVTALEEYKKVAAAVNHLDVLAPELKEAIFATVPH